MKDLILTTAINYDYEQLKLFLNSLNNSFTGEMVIFSNQYYKPRYLNYSLTVIHADDKQVKQSTSLKLNSVINARHFWYLNFLSNHQYDRVLLSDSRDVFFQSNPFDKVYDNRLYVAVEDNTIGNCPFNSRWTKTVYGDDYLMQVKDENIVCAGTTMGNYKIIKDYLVYMSSEVEKYSALDTGHNRDLLIDQTIHNYFCRAFPDKVAKFTNNDDLFLTLGYAESLKLNRAGLLVNNSDCAYSLIHQFDRVKWLSSHFGYQVRDSIQKNNSLNFSLRKGLRKNIKEVIRYASLKDN